MNKKKIAIAALALIVLVGVAYASYWIYSNVVHVTVTESTNYVLTLDVYPTEIEVGTGVQFTGYLKLNDEPVADATIVIHKNPIEAGTGYPIGTTTTSSTGFFSFYYTPDEAGDWYFKAGYEVVG